MSGQWDRLICRQNDCFGGGAGCTSPLAVPNPDPLAHPITRDAFLSLVKVSPAFGDAMLSSLAARLRFLTARL